MSRVYLGRLPYRANERDIERFFQGYGKIYEILLKNGYAFVEFAESRDAEDACHDLNGKSMMGASVMCEVARGTPRGGDRYRFKNTDYSPPRKSSSRRSRSRSKGREPVRSSRKEDKTQYRLVVENLSSRVSWQDLKDFFRKIGEVTYADAHGKKKGEGLVEFSHRSDMKSAIEKMDGKELEGRKIKLVEERKKKRSVSRSRSRSFTPKKRSRSRSRSVTPKKRSRSRSQSAKSGSPSPKKIKTEKEDKEATPEKKESEKNGDGEKNGKEKSRSRSATPEERNEDKKADKSDDKSEKNGDKGDKSGSESD